LPTRIKLTDEGIEIADDKEYFGVLSSYLIIDCKKQKPEQLKQQILDDYQLHNDFTRMMKDSKGRCNLSLEYMKELQEKAEKWDKISKHPSSTEAYHRLEKLEQENKQLKEQNDIYVKHGKMTLDNIKNKEIVQKVRELWKTKPDKWVEQMYEILGDK